MDENSIDRSIDSFVCVATLLLLLLFYVVVCLQGYLSKILILIPLIRRFTSLGFSSLSLVMYHCYLIIA
jgi:hypothetical protein